MIAQPVAVVIDGRLVSSSLPAILVRGRVYAPADPFAGELATSVRCEPGCRYLVVKVRDRSIRISFASERSLANANGKRIDRYVPLARIAAALGDTFVFDARTTTLTIDSRPATALATPTPYVSRTPQANTQTFTPHDVPTPVPTITGIPRPRRTPILVEPESPGP